MIDTTQLQDYLTSLVKELDNPKNFQDAESAARFTQEVRRAYEHLGNLRKIAEGINTQLKEKTPEVFKEHGVSSITVDGYRFTATSTIRASILKDKRAEAHDWLRENDLADLITNTVNASTLSAAAKVQMDNGFELDQDLFRVYHQPNISITKAN